MWTNSLLEKLSHIHPSAKKIFSLRLILFLLFWGFSLESFATHIVAGEITAVKTGTFTYCFTITLYTDPRSPADSPDIDVNFGDGTTAKVDRIGNASQVGTNLMINRYTVCHTFPASGCYLVSIFEENRVADIKNMINSINTPFTVSSQICFFPELGENRSPRFTVPPLDVACPNQGFFHDPGAFDLDGDSLVFTIIPPQKARNTNVDGYQDPNQIGDGKQEDNPNVPAGFTLNPRTGQIVWDSPKEPGNYNIAIKCTEYRNGIPIGYIVRDMKIEVLPTCNNKRPRLTVPNVCVVADDDPATNTNIINVIVTATDPDVSPKDEIRIISSDQGSNAPIQGVYDGAFFKKPATYSSAAAQFGTATGTFNWEVHSEAVRREPYFVVFRAQDQPLVPRGPKLVDVKTMSITVKGPRVNNVLAVLAGRGVNLNWQNYKLAATDYTDAQIAQMKIIIWRREGCNANIACTENPAQLGYQNIGTVNGNITTFKDNGPLAYGLSYSYVLTVNYPEPKGGVSQASIEQCVVLPLDVPFINQVNINKTNQTGQNDGAIQVKWLRPRPSDGNISGTFPLPYIYELYQATGLNGTNFTRVDSIYDAGGTLGTSPVTAFTTNLSTLNTKDDAYLFKVRWYYGPGKTQGIPSDSASSVRLTATGVDNGVDLTWDYKVPWSNQNQYHYIYRALTEQPKANYVLVDSVLVGTPKYADRGQGNCLEIGKTYFYYVKTKGSYNNPQIPEPVGKLLNDSQITSAIPIDNTPPPAPILSIDTVKCALFDANNIFNQLRWKDAQVGDPCQSGVSNYQLFFRPAGESNFSLVSNFDADFTQPYTPKDFKHDNLPLVSGIKSQAGCYFVKAIDRNGNMSAPSDTICQENCLAFELPNVITPNVTVGFNDELKPLKIRYVQSVEMKVFNRWGKKVFEKNDDIQINWNGNSTDGKALPEGVYYYEALVTFFATDPKQVKQNFKGWIHVLR